MALGRKTVFQLKAANWAARTGLGRLRKEGHTKLGELGKWIWEELGVNMVKTRCTKISKN